MLDNFADGSPIPDNGSDLPRNGQLLRVVIRSFLRRHDDIHVGAFTAENLSIQARLAQVQTCSIDLIKQDSRDNAINLQGKCRGFNDINAAHKRVNDDGEARTIVNRYSVGFTVNLDNRFIAMGY